MVKKENRKDKFREKPREYSLAKIRVVGVGGAGSNAVSRMFDDLPRGVDLISINTDLQDLNHTKAKKRIQIGKSVTRGLGTGMNPDLGRQAAEENRAEIADALSGADLIFITAGFGGGSGTGASPIIAEVAQELGILTIAVVTKPFGFEGVKRMQIAEEGLSRIKDRVDTLITIPNDRIFSMVDKDTPLIKAFEVIDDVLKNSVLGITELITIPGTINIDFADVKTIVKDGGSAMIGIGIASGQDRSVAAANLALNSPLLEISIDGAKGVLLSISSNRDLKMNEVNEIAKMIAENVDPSAKIIFGTYHDRKLKKGQLKVTLVATGFNGIFGKNNLLPSLFSSGLAKKPSDGIKDVLETNNNLPPFEVRAGASALNKKEESKSSKEATLFPEKIPVLPAPFHEKTEEVWDIPAFLRKKKKKTR